MNLDFPLPRRLEASYLVIRQLDIHSKKGNSYYLLAPVYRHNNNRFFLKVSPNSTVNAHVYDVLQALSSDSISVPIEIFEDGSSIFQLYSYSPDGCFRDYMNQTQGGEVSLLLVENLVRQINAALRQIHQVGEGSILHCDIKPSNILVTSFGSGDPTFSLIDFDFAITSGLGYSRPSRYTLEYAAPEVIAPEAEVGSAIDYWSLGVLIYEWVTGSNPLHGLSRGKISERHLAFGHGYFDLSVIESTNIRALLGGLICSRAESRWQYKEVNRWLEHDPDTIREGLRNRAETCAQAPHFFGVYLIHSLTNLGSALLRSIPATSADYLSLAAWVGEEFREASDIAEELMHIAEQVDSSAMRIFKLAYRCWPSAPPIWQQRSVSESNILAACRLLLDGDDTDIAQTGYLQWLESLVHETGPLQFFVAIHLSGNQQFREVSQLSTEIISTLTDYHQSWEDIIQAGGADLQAQQPEAPSDYLPQLIYAALDEGYRTARAHALGDIFSSDMILFRQNWFYIFGTNRDISVAKIIILERLELLSRIGEILQIRDTSQLSELDMEGLANSIIRLETQEFGDVAPLPNAQISHLEPGEEFTDNDNQTLLRYLLDRFYLSFNDSWTYVVGRARHLFGLEDPSLLDEDGSESDEEETSAQDDLADAPELPRGFDVYLIPVGLREDLYPLILLKNLYLVRISWVGYSTQRIRITVGKSGKLIKSPLLKVTRLPHRGHMVLLVDQSCSIHCEEKAGIFTTFAHSPIKITIGSKLSTLLSVDVSILDTKRTGLKLHSEFQIPEYMLIKDAPSVELREVQSNALSEHNVSLDSILKVHELIAVSEIDVTSVEQEPGTS